VTLVATPASAAQCTGGSINIVAHPDDDLFFVNPEIQRDIAAGACETTVYVTSGDAGRTDSYYQQRELGVRAAYARMAGVPDKWTTSLVLAGSKIVTKVTLTGRPSIALYFMELPDGFIDGSGSSVSNYASLEKLYTGKSTTLRTVSILRQSYTRTALIDTLGRLIAAQPTSMVRTLDYLGAFGDGDHSDHYAVGRFVRDARNLFRPSTPLQGYLGYTTTRLPANVFGADLQAKMVALAAYAPFDPGTCASLEECSYSDAGDWLARSHTNLDKPPAPPTGSNVAGSSTATASSQNSADGQTADKAIDGVADGYPGDYTREWATAGEGVGAWLKLTWAAPVQLNGVVLFDRPSPYDQITGATLTFSDGSSVTVPPLNNAGTATTVTFPARVTSTVTITVTSVSGSTTNVGLAEVQAWGSGPGVAATTAAPVSTPTTTAAAAAAEPTLVDDVSDHVAQHVRRHGQR
jgi:LmbE family N-acetylglucosaminyl deacetylase